jgi:hypothetical protein
MTENAQDVSERTHVELGSAAEPPAMGERRARWGYGYQDRVATGELLDLLRADIRNGTSHFQGVRLADLQAGRVDDFVLVTDTIVRGNSIKWSAGTHTFPLERITEAYELFGERREGVIKVAIKP